MTAAPDRRQTKTRAALHAAFRSLVLEQGYETLTVGAVADMANVGRSTFYEHYRTMDDLLRASIQGPFTTLADLVGNPQAPDRRDAAGIDRRVDRWSACDAGSGGSGSVVGRNQRAGAVPPQNIVTADQAS